MTGFLVHDAQEEAMTTSRWKALRMAMCLAGLEDSAKERKRLDAEMGERLSMEVEGPDGRRAHVRVVKWDTVMGQRF